ncbi:MAG: alpha/beta fold hydrolase [Phycisphaerales bacterium]|nr:alpha/beta fold hydrolase [Phycisphaerales bacterium]
MRLLRVVIGLVRSKWFWLYAALVAASHAWITWRTFTPPPMPPDALAVMIPRQGDAGPVDPGKPKNFPLVRHRWVMAPEARMPGRPPVVIIHGGPGPGGRQFADFARTLAERGSDVYAVDLPGSGWSPREAPSYSARANARAVLAMMDTMGVPRAHVMGWSIGGAAALWMAELAPQRVASLTLVGSVGTQQTEGSGSHFFERAKHVLGFAFVVGLPEVIPHFGLIPGRTERWVYMRSYWDTDLRPMAELMERVKTPTLVVHGRHDFFKKPYAAEKTAGLIPGSRLVIVDGGHYLQRGTTPDEAAARDDTARAVAAFLDRLDTPGATPPPGVADYAPHEDGGRIDIGAFHLQRDTPWWVIVLAIVGASLLIEDLTTIAVGLLIVSGKIDPFVGLTGSFVGIMIGDYGLWALGRFAGRRVLRWPLFRRILKEESLAKWGRMFDQNMGKAVFLSRFLPGMRTPMYMAAGLLGRQARHFVLWVTVAVAIWTPLLLTLSALIGPPLLHFFRSVLHGPWAVAAAFVVLFVAIRLVAYEATRAGRFRLRADLARIFQREFWPAWLFYLPLLPWIGWLALRHRSLMLPTCVNPGVPNGGGTIGESKAAILRGLASAKGLVEPFELVPVSPPDQWPHARRVAHALQAAEHLGGFPVIAKPDIGQRGHGVKLIGAENDVSAYLEDMTRDALVQRYHPGPCEVGVVWARRADASVPLDDAPGEILSITRKLFPSVVGDGQTTLEFLIWKDSRLRMQADVFLRRFDAQTDRVPAAGERVPLGIAGNHRQGARFEDAPELATPELAASIERIAQDYRGADGGRLDFGRFDLRFADEAELRQGRGFSIIELNGVLAESINVYDARRSIGWAYGVMFRHWRRVFELGAHRRRAGSRPLPLMGVVRALRAHYKGRPGSPISD